MKCERTLNILLNVKNGFETKVSGEEVEELIKFGLVSPFEITPSKLNLEDELKDLKEKFTQASEELREYSKDQIENKRELNNLKSPRKLFGLLTIGNIMKLELNNRKIKKASLLKEKHIYFLKNRILKINAEEKVLRNSIKLNGKRISLSPIGETFIEEIKSRERFLSNDLVEMVNLVEKLNDMYSSLLKQLESVMVGSRFPPIWGIYLINMDLLHLKKKMNHVINKEYYSSWHSIQDKMMDKSLDEAFGNINYISPSQKIMDIFHNNDLYPSKIRKFKKIVKIIGRIFITNLYNVDEELSKEFEGYLDNLEKLVEKYKSTSKDKNELALALLILAVSPNTKKYEFFNEKFKDLADGKEIFSAIAALFPWKAEETWQVILRAESIILGAQSARFISELLTSAILLTMNPKILNIERNLEVKNLNIWNNFLIPAFQVINYRSLEDEFESYIVNRPLSYIISPRYRHYSSLHYHRIG